MANPIRTCLATGEKRPQAELLRFVNVKGAPMPDPFRRLPGRGAYILPSEANLALAVKKKAFAHKLKTNVPPPPWPEIEPLLPKSTHPTP